MKTYEELFAENEALAAKLQKIAYAWMCAGSWPDTVEEKQTIANAINAAPQQCLAEIKAEAGRAGFIACAEWVGDSEYEVSHMLKTADEYAAKIRNTGTWLKDSNVNGGKRQGGE